MTAGIYRIRIDTGGTARGENDILGADEHKPIRVAVGFVYIQTKHAYGCAILFNDGNYHVPVPNGNLLFRHGLFQIFRHQLGGQRPGAGGAGTGIVIRFVSHVFAIAIHGEGHAQLCQMNEAGHGQRRLGVGNVTVHALAAEQILRHSPGRIGKIAAEIQLVVGLFVRARVAGGTHLYPFGEDGNVLHTVFPQAERGIITGRTAAYNSGVHGDGAAVPAADRKNRFLHVAPHSRRMWKPPSTSMDWPVV